jgi:DNA-binding beta-propeller fold protein YncE
MARRQDDIGGPFLPEPRANAGRRMKPAALLAVLLIVLAPIGITVLVGQVTRLLNPSGPVYSVGPAPRDLAFLSDSRRVVFRDGEHGTVTVIDTVTGATQDVPAGPAAAITLAPDGRHAYVLLRDVPAVSMMELDTGRTIWTTPMSGWAVGRDVFNSTRMAVSPDGRRLYVFHRGPDEVTVIDTTQPSVRSTWSVPTDVDFVEVFAAGDTVHLVGEDGVILTLHTETGETLSRWNLGMPLLSAARSPEGRLFVLDDAIRTDALYPSLREVDLVTRTVRAVGDGAATHGLAISADGSTVYVGMRGDGRFAQPEVVAVDARTGSELDTIGTSFNHGFAVSPDGRRIVAADAEDGHGTLHVNDLT